MTALLCRRCDVFVGFGAIGVVHPPKDRDTPWLREHCWVCERTKADILTGERLSAAMERHPSRG